jgi:hypothetical protein
MLLIALQDTIVELEQLVQNQLMVSQGIIVMLDTTALRAQVLCSCVLMVPKQQILTKALVDHAQPVKVVSEGKSSHVAQENTVMQTRIIPGEDYAQAVLIWREPILAFHQVIHAGNVHQGSIALVAGLLQTHA